MHFDITEKRFERLACLAPAVLVASALLLLPGIQSACAQATQSADKTVLHGKVIEHDRFVRLQRPSTPSLSISHDGQGSKLASGSHEASIDMGTDQFLFNFKSQKPVADTLAAEGQPAKAAKATEPDLFGEEESGELVIAWEAWHKRVSGAIFERWRVNGKLPGVAHVELRFTRDRHVIVDVQDVYIDPDVYNLLPEGSPCSPEYLRKQFTEEIMSSVQPLDGSSVLDFPAKSKRTVVYETPAFRGTRGPASYSWKHDDYERVPQ